MPYFIRLRDPQAGHDWTPAGPVDKAGATAESGSYRSLDAARRAVRNWPADRMYSPQEIIHQPSGQTYRLRSEPDEEEWQE